MMRLTFPMLLLGSLSALTFTLAGCPSQSQTDALPPAADSGQVTPPSGAGDEGTPSAAAGSDGTSPAGDNERPPDGDAEILVVGSLRAAKDVQILASTYGEHFTLGGAFMMADSSTLETVESEELGECSVTIVPTSEPQDFMPPMEAEGIATFDPGSPGEASNGSVVVDLLGSDGMFFPDVGADLLALGFDAGQTITFAFPGGADIGAFEASIEVPQDLNITSPDLSDPDLSLDLGAALDVAWTAGDPVDTVAVSVMAGGVLVKCEFPDIGSGTIPADLMSRLPAEAEHTTLTVIRKRDATAKVPLHRVGATGIVYLMASTGVARGL